MRRFLPMDLFQGQLRVLSDYRQRSTRPDLAARAIVIFVPVVVFVAMLIARGVVADVSAMIAGTAVLAGTLLAAFGQVSAWRDQLTARSVSEDDESQLDRDSLDETVTHILAAAYTLGLATVLLVLAANFGRTGAGEDVSYGGVWLWAGCAIASHSALTFLIAVPRLYAAYVGAARVRRELSNLY